MAKIACIGLGNMGLPMAVNLYRFSHSVRGVETNPIACEAAQTAGIALGDIESITAFAPDILLTMLPNGEIVHAVCGQFYPLLPKGCLHIDCSTIAVEQARALANAANTHGIAMLDAPVSGGVAGAVGASLTFMVGGKQPDLLRAESVLQAMGKKIVHCGDHGAGQAAKACNNMLLAISMIGVAEAFKLAEGLGLSAEALFAVSSTATGQCWSLNSYCPVAGLVAAAPSNHEYQAGFAASLMLKDLSLAQQAAENFRVETPLGTHATELYAKMVDAGAGEQDFSAIIQHLSSKD